VIKGLLKKQTRLVVLMRPSGHEYELELPIRTVTCSRCEGKGSHVDPSVDWQGITESEAASLNDPDFWHSYREGDYDVPCEVCLGRRLVDEVDLDILPPITRDDYLRANDALDHEKQEG
jgi:hypothetical protein